MKLAKSKLKQLIKEKLETALSEVEGSPISTDISTDQVRSELEEIVKSWDAGKPEEAKAAITGLLSRLGSAITLK